MQEPGKYIKPLQNGKSRVRARRGLPYYRGHQIKLNIVRLVKRRFSRYVSGS